MSKPRYIWWGYAKGMVRAYPELRAEYHERQNQKITREIAAAAVGTVTSRTTENTAIRQLPPAKQAEYDAVTKAVEATRRLKTGPERLSLIDMVYWKQSHTLDGAAYALGYSYENAKRFHGDFLRMVGLNRGLMDPEDVA